VVIEPQEVLENPTGWRMGLGNYSRQLLKEVETVRSMDLVLPVKETQSQGTHVVRLRVVACPDPPVAPLLQRLGLVLPSAPKAGAKCSGE